MATHTKEILVLVATIAFEFHNESKTIYSVLPLAFLLLLAALVDLFVLIGCKTQAEAVAVARRLLQREDEEELKELVDHMLKRLKAHTVRIIHYNPKNWGLLKYLDPKYREPKGEWRHKLIAKLMADGTYAQYLSCCCSSLSNENSNSTATARYLSY